jgi:hypothetical protein
MPHIVGSYQVRDEAQLPSVYDCLDEQPNLLLIELADVAHLLDDLAGGTRYTREDPPTFTPNVSALLDHLAAV